MDEEINRESLPTRILMLSGGILMSLTMVALTPVLPAIESELAVTANDKMLVKQLVTITGITMVFGAPLAGYLFDRMSARPVLVAAALLYALAGTAGLYLEDLQSLLISRLFVGFAAAAIAAASMTLINVRLAGNVRARWMGAHVATAIVGALVLHPIAGGLGELGWRWPFLLYVIGIVVVVLALMLDERAAAPTKQSIEETQNDAALVSWFPIRFALLAVIMGAITYLPVVYLPFLVRQIGIESPLVISLVGLGDAGLSAIFAFMFARARQQFSSPTLFLYSFGCAALGLGIAGMATGFWTIVLGMMIYGLGLGWFVPNLMTAAGDAVSSARQGRTVGLVKAAHYLAAPTCVLLVEPIAQRLGPQAGMQVAALLALGLATIFIASLFLKDRAPTESNVV